MKSLFKSLAIVALVGLANAAPLSTFPAMAQEAAPDFSGSLFIFFDPEKYRAWRGNTGGPNAFQEATAVPPKLADVSFLVMLSQTGCKPGSDGKCNVTADYTLYDPSGVVVVDDRGRKVWTGYAQPAGVSSLSEQPIPAMLESSDPRGAYKLHVVLHDNVADTSIELERILTLEERS
jgi:hypothetical protein